MIDRYISSEMKQIWSLANKYETWLEVELSSLKAFVELGVIKQEEYDVIKANTYIDCDLIEEIEQVTRHDVVAFTRSLSTMLGEESKWIHYGLTSTDVVDTANGVLFKQANALILKQLEALIETIKGMAIKYKDTLCMGRTHGVHGEITTFGFKMALWYDEMTRHLERFKQASQGVEFGKIAGAVGTYSNVDPFVQEFVCQDLGLGSANIATQTLQRDRHGDYMACLALIGSSLDKFAVEIRHLQRTEVFEVIEGFNKGQKGSSAMPHKKNPISSENVSGLARLLRGYMVSSYENIALWHERDISHSSVERVIFEDATAVMEYMLKRFNNILINLGVNEARMLKNIALTKNVIFSQKVLLRLIDRGCKREEAYDFVQEFANYAFSNELDFKEVIKDQPLIKMLTNQEFEGCFNYYQDVKNIDYVYKKLKLI